MYLRSNPLAEHNAGIALSSKDVPQNASGTGNMYQGQAGRAFVQNGGGMSQFHSFDGGNVDSAYARGSYAPVTVGYNSVTQGGGRGSKKGKRSSRTRSRSRRCKKCKCDIVTGVGGKSRSRSRSRSRSKTLRRKMKRCRCHRNLYNAHTRQHGGGVILGNAAYSTGGSLTEVGPSTTALANPTPITAYNSCSTAPQ